MRFEVRRGFSATTRLQDQDDEYSGAVAEVIEDHGSTLLCAVKGIGDVWLSPRRIGQVVSQ